MLEIIPSANGNQLVITNQTPFYGESGWQMGDVGTLTTLDNKTFKVSDTKKFLGKIHAHYVEKGELKIGDNVTLSVNAEYRNNLRAHHSATHLLHLALRQVLGDHLTQKGSLVAENRLRFDFSHNKSMSAEEIMKVEEIVNQMIRQNNQTCTQLMSTEQAIASGAMALFGEKYEEEVRVVSMGSSTELCGGTHVRHTGDIGILKIISEGAIAAGIRRIEAICGKFALSYINEQEQKLNELANILKTPKAEIVEKVNIILRDKKALEEELTEAKRQLLLLDTNIKTSHFGKITLIEKFTDNVDVKDLRNFVDHMRQTSNSIIIIAGSRMEGKTSLIIGMHADLGLELDAAELIRKANELAGGQGGGGRKELAQAGGFDFTKIDIISQYIHQILADKFKN